MPKKRLTAAERRAAARRYVEERGHLRQAYKVVHSAQPPSQEGTVQAPIPDPPPRAADLDNRPAPDDTALGEVSRAAQGRRRTDRGREWVSRAIHAHIINMLRS
jgi:hypothetical protein